MIFGIWTSKNTCSNIVRIVITWNWQLQTRYPAKLDALIMLYPAVDGISLYPFSNYCALKRKCRFLESDMYNIWILGSVCDSWEWLLIIIVIIKALSQLCWGQLHESCFAIPIYSMPNPWIGFASLDLSLLLPSMSSLAYPFRGAINLYRETFPRRRRWWPAQLNISKPT